jgi:hypothetical protein
LQAQKGMIAQPQFTPRFVRKTQLGANEYRKNFHQIDDEIIAVVTSPQADAVTPLMSKIYLRLVRASAQYWEREGVLRFEAEVREGKQVKAWSVLCELIGVASATASKALTWMHDQGIIGYFAGKNGVGIRIFLNRAISSIGLRTSKKILEFSPASSRVSPASPNEPAFNDSFAVREVSDTDLNPCAPKSGAEDKIVGKTSPEPKAEQEAHAGADSGLVRREVETTGPKITSSLSINEIVRRLKVELEPTLQTAAQQAARREHERTREWLENKGLPKAARVAQREAYNVLRNHGVISNEAERSRADLAVGRNNYTAEAKPLNDGEIRELAEMCVAMLETHGQAIDTTLAEISSEAGGCLLPEDAPLVRDLAESMIQESKG